MWQPKEHSLPAVRSYVDLCICCINTVILIWMGCCRFMVNMDPAMMELNAQLLQRPVSPQVQTPEQIEAIVKQARVAQTTMSPNWAEGL